MVSILARASLRYGLGHPWQVLLAALGIALGVAVVTAIDLTRASASRSFDDATESVVGRTTHQVLGGPGGLKEHVYTELRRSGVVRQLAPVIEARLELPEHGGRGLRMLGVDPFVELPMRAYWSDLPPADMALARLVTGPRTALVSARAASRLNLRQGGKLRVALGGHAPVSLEILAVIDPAGRFPALAGTELVLVDISTAQDLLGMSGRLSRIDLILRDRAQAEKVAALIGPDARLISAQTRTAALANMTRAFHTNLIALSLLALLVGMFLVYNSQTFMVIQRREQFGILRALGLHRRQLAALVLAEAALLGLVGTLAGLGLGWLLARGLLGMVTQTINDLYYALALGNVVLDRAAVFKGALLGLGASVAAALVPAREAARAEPRVAMSRAELEGRVGVASAVALWLGLGSAGIGGAVLLLPTASILAGLAGLFLIVVGCALMAPELTARLTCLLQHSSLARKSVPLWLALRGVTGSLSRTGVAAAALMLAVSHTIGVGLMVESFRGSVTDWLTNVLRADYYLDIPANAALGASPTLTTTAVAAIAALPGVEEISHVRHVELASSRGIDAIIAYQLNERARAGFRFLVNPSSRNLWARFEEEDTVLVSEPYAYHRGVTVGDSISLSTDKGERTFEVIAVYQDYTRDRGTVAVSRSTYDRYWRDAAVNGVGIYAGRGFALERFESALVRILGQGSGIEVIANRVILEHSLRVFDRTFTITEVLRLLAGLIAFIGVFSALMAIQLERARELGVLKAVGVTPGQIRRIVLGETALIGGAAGLFAVPVGTLMALILAAVINRRSFGWTMGLELDYAVLLGGFLMALVAALVAGLYPAARMAQARPAEVLRQE